MYRGAIVNNLYTIMQGKELNYIINKKKSGFISIFTVIVFAVIFPMMMFVSYEYSVVTELKHKITNISEEISEISAFSVNQSSLSKGELELVEAEITSTVNNILKKSFYLTDTLEPTEISILKEKPIVSIIILDKMSDMGSEYVLDSEHKFYISNPTVIIDVSLVPDTILFPKEWGIRVLSSDGIRFYDLNSDFAIVNNPLLEEDIVLKIENIVNPYRFKKNMFTPLTWEFSRLPMASGGEVSFSAMFKDEEYMPQNVISTVMVEGVNTDESLYIEVFDVPMYSVIDASNLTTSTHPTPDSSISVFKITNPYDFDIPVNWIDLSTYGNFNGKVIARGLSDTYIEVPSSSLFITYTSGSLLTNGFSLPDVTIESPRNYTATNSNNGDGISTGKLIASKFKIPYEAPIGSIVSIWINSSGEDISGNPLIYSMPSREIGEIENNLNELLRLE